MKSLVFAEGPPFDSLDSKSPKGFPAFEVGDGIHSHLGLRHRPSTLAA